MILLSIKNISDFINELKKIPAPRKTELFFRGHSDIDYELKPGIYRNTNLISNEHILFKEFILRTPTDFLNEKSALEKLVKMQHYGLPTRLLDITSNPLVALYFACNGDYKKDGKVISFRIPNSYIKYYDSDTVSILSNISKRPDDFNIKDIANLNTKEFNEKENIQYLLHEIREEKAYFQSIINPEDIGKVVAVKVKQSNIRIIKQSGAFLIFGINIEKMNPAMVPIKWIVDSSKEKIDFTINKDDKKLILKELDSLGINEATLFPELDNQARYLKNKYV
ncbi:FRG domain protein [Solobacterium moorei F0204]|uniref:FRG domain protein n=1 Tax=Solobacterium moorei F0204 TaxID=706433 RepID=E7MQK6_9FIRM|nr:FRG domain protein [Solobacterium moorei F0204]